MECFQLKRTCMVDFARFRLDQIYDHPDHEDDFFHRDEVHKYSLLRTVFRYLLRSSPEDVYLILEDCRPLIREDRDHLVVLCHHLSIYYDPVVRKNPRPTYYDQVGHSRLPRIDQGNCIQHHIRDRHFE